MGKSLKSLLSRKVLFFSRYIQALHTENQSYILNTRSYFTQLLLQLLEGLWK